MARKFENELGQMRTDRGLFIDKGNYYVDPRHPDFGGGGARGDGVNDDGIAFNDARDHLPTEGGTVVVGPGDYLLTTAFTFGGQDNVVLWFMPGVVLTGAAFPTATGNNFILDWRSGNVDTSIAGTATGDITRVNITAGTGLTGTVDTTTGAHTQTLAISGYIGETSIVTLGTIATGAIPASLVTSGTFGTGAYSFDNTVTVAGVLSVDDTTDASSVTVASIHTDGGLGVAGEIITTGKISIGPNTIAPVASGADLYIEDVTATIVLRDTNAGADEKAWNLSTDGAGNLRWGVTQDDWGGFNQWMTVTRTGTTIDLFQITNATEIQLDAGASGVRTSSFFNTDNSSGTYRFASRYALEISSTTLQIGVSPVNWGAIIISESTILTTVAGPLTVAEALTATGAVSVDDTTESTSTVTGSIHTDGGLGVVLNTFLGGTLTVAGVLSVDDTTESTSALTGSIHTDGGVGVAKDLFVGSQVTVGGSGIQAGITLSLHGNGVLSMLETTTPTANTNYGAVYTKSDNKLYFQDGAGAEHEVAFV